MSWLTETADVSWYHWGLVLYTVCATATILFVAYLGFKVGFAKGYQRGKSEQLAPRFRQRKAGSRPGRFAMITRARIMARRQRAPEPRR